VNGRTSDDASSNLQRSDRNEKIKEEAIGPTVAMIACIESPRSASTSS